MDGLGWHNLARYVHCLVAKPRYHTHCTFFGIFSMLMDADVGIQEQAFHVVRHLAEPEEGIDMVFQEMGEQVLLGSLSIALESEHEDVVRQVRFISNIWYSNL